MTGMETIEGPGGFEYGMIVINFPTICPPGNAEGAFELRNRGHGSWGEITCWPSTQRHPLFHGGVDPDKNIDVNIHGTRLWQQEMYMYMQERKKLVIEATINLDEVKAIPRMNSGKFDKSKGHWVANKLYHSTKPRPEDFGTEWEKVRKWLGVE